jgi:asparagine synthase (glutamine-hydrolysing)
MGAYQKWGEGCPNHLIGAFAFAIWDKRAGTLVCARDHLGVKPLHYYEMGDVFAFSTEPKGILSLPFVDCILDESRLLKSLNWVPRDQTETVFKNIKKLNRSSVLACSRTSVRNKTYWTIEPSPEAEKLSDNECIERFRKYFTTAVRCRLRTANNVVACDLSGGLDSSSVTCIAKNIIENSSIDISLLTASAVFSETKGCDEKKYIDEVKKYYGIEGIEVDINKYGPLSTGHEIYSYVDDGTTGAGNTFVKWIVWKSLRNTNARIVLTGTDGDTTIMDGLELFIELARDGRFKNFDSQLYALKSNLEKENNEYSIQMSKFTKKDRYIEKYIEPYLTKWALEYNISRFVRALKYMKRSGYRGYIASLRLYYKKLFAPYWLYKLGHSMRNRGGATTEVHPMINESYRDRDDLRSAIDELNALSLKVPSVRGQQLKLWKSGLHVGALENADSFAAPHGLEPRHPFMDIRLLRFCLGMRSELSLRDGWTRYILREAMSHVLPERIRFRTAKANLERMFDYGLFQVDHELAKEQLANLGPFERYLNKEYLSRFLREKFPGEVLDTTLLCSALTKPEWLNNVAKRSGKQPVIR